MNDEIEDEVHILRAIQFRLISNLRVAIALLEMERVSESRKKFITTVRKDIAELEKVK